MGYPLRHQAFGLRGFFRSGVLAALGCGFLLGANPGVARAACDQLDVELRKGSAPFKGPPADTAFLYIAVYDSTPSGVVPIVGPGGEPGIQNGLPVQVTINSVPREVILSEIYEDRGVFFFDGGFSFAPRSVPRNLPEENQVADGEGSYTVAYDDDDCPDPIDVAGSFAFPPRNLYVADYSVVDYGDGDGFADPGEIVDLFPRIVNDLGYDLTSLRAVLSSDDAGVSIVRDEAAYGSLVAGGETAVPVAGPIRLVATEAVAGIGRWPFRILLYAGEFAGPSREGALALPMARDAASNPGAGPDFSENFDSPSSGGDGVHSFQLGALFPVNTEALVDGSRCQNSAAFFGGTAQPSRCRPWKGSDWHQDAYSTERPTVALSGDGALHMGRHFLFETSPSWAWLMFRDVTFGQLSAAVSPPIALGLDAPPTLSFWQIASLERGMAGGVLQASTDGGISWTTVSELPINGPEDQAIENPGWLGVTHFECSFDPIDDGSTEDSRFDPPEPDPYFAFLGPSSFCTGRAARPTRTWGKMGDAEVQNGLAAGSEQTASVAGSTGGAWVRSVANLQGYRGETVLLRFVASTTNQRNRTNPDATDGIGWGNSINAFAFSIDFTRGWLLDDILVTGTSAAPVSLTADLEPPPPPGVVNVSPAAGEAEVAPLPTIALTFTQPMDAGTLSADTLTLTGPLGRVDASRAALQDGLGASLVPTSALLDGTRYVIDAGAELRNIAGDPLVPFSSSFTTAPFRATDPSRAHPPVDAEVSGFAVPAAIDIDQVSLRIASYDLGGGTEEPVIEAEVILANGGGGFEADSTITVYLDFGEEGLGSADAEPGLSDTQDVSLSVRFRNPGSNRRSAREAGVAVAPVPRFTGFAGLGDLSSVAPGRIVFRVRLADLMAAASDEQRAAAAAADDGTLTLRAWSTTRLRAEKDFMPDTDDNGTPSVASETLALRFAAP